MRGCLHHLNQRHISPWSALHSHSTVSFVDADWTSTRFTQNAQYKIRLLRAILSPREATCIPHLHVQSPSNALSGKVNSEAKPCGTADKRAVDMAMADMLPLIDITSSQQPSAWFICTTPSLSPEIINRSASLPITAEHVSRASIAGIRAHEIVSCLYSSLRISTVQALLGKCRLDESGHLIRDLLAFHLRFHVVLTILPTPQQPRWSCFPSKRSRRSHKSIAHRTLMAISL